MHFRKITESDIARLQMNLLDIINPIMNYFGEILEETFDAEYREYKTKKEDHWQSNWLSLQLSTKKHTSLELYKTSNNNWFKINLVVTGFVTYLYYFNIDFRKIIKSINEIMPYLTYFGNFIYAHPSELIEENVNGIDATGASIKIFQICFPSVYFNKHSSEIFTIISDLVNEIENELLSINNYYLDKKDPTSSPKKLILLKKEEWSFEDKPSHNVPIIEMCEDWSEVAGNFTLFSEGFSFPWQRINENLFISETPLPTADFYD